MSKRVSFVASGISLTGSATEYPLVVTVPQGYRVVEVFGSFDGTSSSDDRIDTRISRVSSISGGDAVTGVMLDAADSVPSGFSAVKEATSLTIGATPYQFYASPQGDFRYTPALSAGASQAYAIVLAMGAQSHNGTFRIVCEGS